MSTQTLTLHIQGMHCKACTILAKSAAEELPYISRATADLRHHTIVVEGVLEPKLPAQIAADLTERLHTHGYTVSVERRRHPVRWGDFKLAVPIALMFAAAFVLLQKLGLVSLVGGGSMTMGGAFAIGVVASLSTCMAVVGGLVLSMSATFAKEGDRVRPQILFHIGRLLSFVILGGVIGAIGAAFTLNTTATFVLTAAIGLIMLTLGINLLDIFHWSKRLQPAMPAFIARHTYGIAQVNHTLTPFAVGVATFFLPCGFTQAMQLYTLGTGSFTQGALTMGAFALGTLPVLGLLSFSSFSIARSAWAGVFFKTAGLVVVLFALYNLLNALVIIGIIQPLFGF
jgi:sulfite exporter TauE/SafE